AAAMARAFALVHATALAGVLPGALAAGAPRLRPRGPPPLSRLPPPPLPARGRVAAPPGVPPRPPAPPRARRPARPPPAAPPPPELWRGAGDAADWLGRRESFQAMVSESQPLLLGEDGRVAFTTAAARLSWLALGAPVLLALAAGWAWRRTVAAPLLLWVG